MSTFIMTPTNIDIIDSLIRDPMTGQWVIPILKFNPLIYNPYYGEVDPLNEDRRYQDKVIDHFYTRLTEKWLFKDPEFRKLLKYFRVEKTGEQGEISLIKDLDNAKDQDLDKVDRKYVFKYIEKYFISRMFVERVLRDYVNRAKVKWYDLYSNTDILKELFAHKLKKLIASTVYELRE